MIINRGMGDPCNAGDSDYNPALCLANSLSTEGSCVNGVDSNTGNSCSSNGPGSVVNTGSTTSNPSSIINTIASDFANIFKAIQPLPAGCTQVAGPYGTSTQCVGAGQASTLSLNSVASSLGTSSSTLLLMGGAVLVFMMMSKKG